MMEPLLRLAADAHVVLLLVVAVIAACWAARRAAVPEPVEDGWGPGYLLASPPPPELAEGFAARGIDPAPSGVKGIHDRPRGDRP